MPYKPINFVVDGTLTADIGTLTALIPVDAITAGALAANFNFAGGEFTYLRLYNESYFEEVRVVNAAGTNLHVERATSGTTARVFSAIDTVITASFGESAVEDIIEQNPAPTDIEIFGNGIATATRTGNEVVIDVPTPNFTGDNGIEVVGAWPNITIALEAGAGGCCPGEGTGPVTGGGVTVLNISSAILQGEIVDNVLNLALLTPTFTAGANVTITGDWPDYTISAAGGGGSGSVTSVAAGSGLVVTGNPAINPTVSLTNTGVAAGDYSGFVVDAQGRITNLPVGFGPISTIVIAAGAGSVGKVGGTATITLDTADIGQPGIVALADHTAPLDTGDSDTAVTPALLAAVMGGGTTTAVGTSTAEADGLYTNTIAGTGQTLTLAAGEKAILIGEVTLLNNTTPLNPVAYGVAVFTSGGVKLYGSKISTQSKQPIVGIVNGPITTTVAAVVTTALPADSAVQGASLAIFKINA